jgi:hypothetical protein
MGHMASLVPMQPIRNHNVTWCLDTSRHALFAPSKNPAFEMDSIGCGGPPRSLPAGAAVEGRVAVGRLVELLGASTQVDELPTPSGSVAKKAIIANTAVEAAFIILVNCGFLQLRFCCAIAFPTAHRLGVSFIPAHICLKLALALLDNILRALNLALFSIRARNELNTSKRKLVLGYPQCVPSCLCLTRLKHLWFHSFLSSASSVDDHLPCLFAAQVAQKPPFDGSGEVPVTHERRCQPAPP